MGQASGRGALEAAASETVSPEAYEARVPRLRVELLNAQFDLQGAPFAVLVLLAGDDVQACNEVLHVLHQWMDARYLPVVAFDRPSDEERERPRFWRYWREIPARGEARVFFGGWALHAVAERLRRELDAEGFARRLAHGAAFERALVDDGALLLKFWLHRPEGAPRRRRGRRRLGRREKEIDVSRRRARRLVEELLVRTHAPDAPWHVVGTADPRARDLRVARTILEALSARLASVRPPPSAAVRAQRAAASARGGGARALDAVDLTAALPHPVYRERLEALQVRLAKAQARARRRDVASVLVFEGWDAAGKGGSIRRITAALDARDYRVVPVGAPSPEEQAHHYLWRFWRQLPRAGHMRIFDRSWYGRVLVERVEGLTPEDAWQRAYDEIVDFEAQITEHGAALCKFWLHVDPEEQLRRFRAREETPYKKYKIGREDYRNRARREDYESAVEEMVARTHRPYAPWRLVAAQDKRWARVQILEAVCDALEAAAEAR